MHLYAFGSICRGEIDLGSDVDLLACIDDTPVEIDVEKYSIYHYDRLVKLWEEGNPFAWHLYLESKLLFASDGDDFLRGLGKPKEYSNASSDLDKFRLLFERSYTALSHSKNSTVFHLSCIFLAIRNYATCYSLSIQKPIFSRNSPLLINPKLNIDPKAFSILVRARLLSTRGFGVNISDSETVFAHNAVSNVLQWMDTLRSNQSNERI
ncbi:hypothetical protein FPD75_07730 [Salmonella enterica subsp. enterica]|nr:hypothetical protein [Salmonella enterica subsp. enterica serovar Diguel]EHE5991477.1 hypothetical protein [Salmonella enterica]